MNGNRDVSDYPEHLNPFREDRFSEKMRFWTLGRKGRSNSFSTSLKDFKNSVRQSFRGKRESNKHAGDKDGVKLRNKTDSMNGRQTQTIQFVSTPSQKNFPATSPALPRSRFSERVSPKTDKINGDVNCDTNSTKFEKEAAEGDNPFSAEDEERKSSRPEDGAERRRRRKKKAPPPPLLANQTINEETGLSIPNSNSKWSLTSTETEISVNSNCSVGEDYGDERVNLEFQNLTKDIEKLTDGTDNEKNSIEQENKVAPMAGDKSEIPDLVISCENNKDGDEDDYEEESQKENGERVGDSNNNEIDGDKKMEGDSNNNLEEDIDARGEIEENNNHGDVTKESDDAPTPKIRKSKITKTTMLGKEAPYPYTPE